MRSFIASFCVLVLITFCAPARSAEVVPAGDPPVGAGEVPRLLPNIAKSHPRLLFNADDLPALRQRAKLPVVKPFYDQLLAYLPACNPPKDNKYVTDATDAQRQGLWRMPTLAVHYAITGDKKSYGRAVGFLQALLKEPNWETGGEPDMGMAAANIMVGAAIVYDTLYNDLPVELRKQVRDRLLLQARRMYYGGHLMKAGKVHYWQNDPQNNHRWHRDAGLALAVLAIVEENTPDTDWILARTVEELKFISTWLPTDGSSHESATYLVFGGPHLVLALDAADRCLGTKFMQQPFFANAADFRLQCLTPGLSDGFSFGDGVGFGAYNAFLFRGVAIHQRADANAGLLQLFNQQKSAFEFGWMSLLWFDPSLTGGSLDKLPTRYLCDDLGLAILRDSWQPDGVAAMFKCGIYGGKTLNDYRNRNKFKYINVAHDDPDANTFVLFANKAFVADNDRYSGKKQTSNHNTILVNGAGQKGEGSKWTQPLKGDMTQTARNSAWHDGGANGVSVVEGEAGGLYPALDAYRRTVLWSPGKYVLLLDSIAAPKPVPITWLMQSKEVTITKPAGVFMLKNGDAARELRVASDTAFEPTIADSSADNHGKAIGLRQLQLAASTGRWRLASVFNPWNDPKLAVTMVAKGEGFEVTVASSNGSDIYLWTPVANAKDQTRLSLNGKAMVMDPPKDSTVDASKAKQ